MNKLKISYSKEATLKWFAFVGCFSEAQWWLGQSWDGCE